MKKNIDEIILESLFYTPLTLEQIILDLDKNEVKNFPELNLDVLEKELNFL